MMCLIETSVFIFEISCPDLESQNIESWVGAVMFWG